MVRSTAESPREALAPPVRRGRGDGGAVIVEAALVLPLLFLLIFGMIDFGVTLSDQIAVRDGVREGARQAAVSAPGARSVPEVVALTKQRVGVETSGTRVHVNPQANSSASPTIAAGAPGSWVTVCAYVPMRSLSGMFSLVLDGQYMWSKTSMRVEQQLTYTGAGGDPAPAGKTWSGCHV